MLVSELAVLGRERATLLVSEGAMAARDLLMRLRGQALLMFKLTVLGREGTSLLAAKSPLLRSQALLVSVRASVVQLGGESLLVSKLALLGLRA